MHYAVAHLLRVCDDGRTHTRSLLNGVQCKAIKSPDILARVTMLRRPSKVTWNKENSSREKSTPSKLNRANERLPMTFHA